jgi:hypothetical protein
MTDEYDRQKDIEAEGQRAAVFHSRRRESEGALPQRGQRRLVGISPDGHRVNNVTRQNRWQVNNSIPWVDVNLMDEDMRSVLHRVQIPNTRERPDIVVHLGIEYIVVDTLTSPMLYRVCMVQRVTKYEKGQP